MKHLTKKFSKSRFLVKHVLSSQITDVFKKAGKLLAVLTLDWKIKSTEVSFFS